VILVIPPTLGLKGSGAFYTCERKVARRLVGKGTFCPPPKKIIWRDLKRKAFVFFAAFVWGWGGGRDGKIAQVGEGSFLELHSMRKRQDFAFDFYLIRFTSWDPHQPSISRKTNHFWQSKTKIVRRLSARQWSTVASKRRLWPTRFDIIPFFAFEMEWRPFPTSQQFCTTTPETGFDET